MRCQVPAPCVCLSLVEHENLQFDMYRSFVGLFAMTQGRDWCIFELSRRCSLSILLLILPWALVDRALAGNKVRGIDPQGGSSFGVSCVVFVRDGQCLIF